MTRRTFTPAQANRTLPLVGRIVADILVTGRELRNLVGEIMTDREARETHPAFPRFQALRDRIKELMGELEEVGCSYKDWSFDRGLVDFPSTIDGKQVLLCWRSDEEEVRWFHGAEEGYAGRRPIPVFLLEEAEERQ